MVCLRVYLGFPFVQRFLNQYLWDGSGRVQCRRERGPEAKCPVGPALLIHKKIVPKPEIPLSSTGRDTDLWADTMEEFVKILEDMCIVRSI